MAKVDKFEKVENLVEYARSGQLDKVKEQVDRYNRNIEKEISKRKTSNWNKVGNLVHNGSFSIAASTPKSNSYHEAATDLSENQTENLPNDITQIDIDSLNEKEKKSGDAPLHAAIRTNHTDIALYLLDHPYVNYNLTVESGITPLHLACITGNRAIVQKLCQYQKLDLNARSQPLGYSALDWAIYNRHEDIIKDLIAAGADLFGTNCLHYLPIQQALIYCSLPTIITMLKRMEPYLPEYNEGPAQQKRYLKITENCFDMPLAHLAAENRDPAVKNFMHHAEHAWREGRLQSFLENFSKKTAEKEEIKLLPISIDKAGLDGKALERINGTDKFLLSSFILKHYQRCTPQKQKFLIENNVLSKLLSIIYEFVNESIRKLINAKEPLTEAQLDILDKIALHLLKAKNEEEVANDCAQIRSKKSLEALLEYVGPLAKVNLNEKAQSYLNDNDKFPLSSHLISQFRKCSISKQEELVNNNVLTKILGDGYESLTQHIKTKFLATAQSSNEQTKILEDIAVYLLKAQSEQDTEYDYHKLLHLESIEELRKNIKSFADYQKEILRQLFAPGEGLIQGKPVNLASSSTRRFLALYQDADTENRNILDHINSFTLPVLKECKAAFLQCTEAFLKILDKHLPLSAETLKNIETKKSVLISENMSGKESEEDKQYKRALTHRVKIATGYVKEVVDCQDKASLLELLKKMHEICTQKELPTLSLSKISKEEQNEQDAGKIHSSIILQEIESLLLTPELEALIYKATKKHLMLASPVVEESLSDSASHQETQSKKVADEPLIKTEVKEASNTETSKPSIVLIPSSPSPTPHTSKHAFVPSSKHISQKLSSPSSAMRRSSVSPKELQLIKENERQKAEMEKLKREIEDFKKENEQQRKKIEELERENERLKKAQTEHLEIHTLMERKFEEYGEKVATHVVAHVEGHFSEIKSMSNTLVGMVGNCQELLSGAQKENAQLKQAQAKPELTEQEKKYAHQLERLKQRFARRLQENEILPGSNSDEYLNKLRKKITEAEYDLAIAAKISEKSHTDDAAKNLFINSLAAYIDDGKLIYREIASGRREPEKSLTQKTLEGGMAAVGKLTPGGKVVSAAGEFISSLYFSRLNKAQAQTISQFANSHCATEEANKKLAEHLWNIYKDTLTRADFKREEITRMTGIIAGYIVSKLWLEKEASPYEACQKLEEIDNYCRLAIRKIRDYAGNERFYNKEKLSMKIGTSSAYISSLLAKVAFVLPNGALVVHKSRIKKDSEEKAPGQKCALKYSQVFIDDTILTEQDVLGAQYEKIQTNLSKYAATDLFKQRLSRATTSDHFSPQHMLQARAS